MAEWLRIKGYIVHGSSTKVPSDDTYNGYHQHWGDLTDLSSLISLLLMVKPDEIYNYGALSHVGQSFTNPLSVLNVCGSGVLRLLEAIRISGLTKVKVFHASSTAIFESGSSECCIAPKSPYAASKALAHIFAKIYRETHGIFICSGVMSNHESIHRNCNFVSRKISRGLCEIKLGVRNFLTLGNLDSLRDWGHAKDFVRAHWLILQEEMPQDYIISTGKVHTVKEFVEIACKKLDIMLAWEGEGLNAVGIDQSTRKGIIVVDPALFRPNDIPAQCRYPSELLKIGWQPEFTFEDLVHEMVDHDYQDVSHNIKNHLDIEQR